MIYWFQLLILSFLDRRPTHPLCENSRWKPQVPRSAFGERQLRMGFSRNRPQDSYSWCCLQRIEQRVGAHQDFGEELHHHHRCHSIQAVLRSSLLASFGSPKGQDSTCRRWGRSYHQEARKGCDEEVRSPPEIRKARTSTRGAVHAGTFIGWASLWWLCNVKTLSMMITPKAICILLRLSTRFELVRLLYGSEWSLS